MKKSILNEIHFDSILTKAQTNSYENGDKLQQMNNTTNNNNNNNNDNNNADLLQHDASDYAGHLIGNAVADLKKEIVKNFDLNINSCCGAVSLNIDEITPTCDNTNCTLDRVNSLSHQHHRSGSQRKKSVSFVEDKEHTDLDTSDIKVINVRRNSCKKSEKSHHEEPISVPPTIDNVSTIPFDETAKLLSQQCASLLQDDENPIELDRFQSRALKDISTELVNYVINNAVKIVANEIKVGV